MPDSSHLYYSRFNAMPSYPAMPTHSVNSNSSAFSVNAQPHEDWTQVSDLAERRRIQNRIAQRNYRKKLKRRLEDLEKRAGSSSASPEPATVESDVKDAAAGATTGRKRQSTSGVSRTAQQQSSRYSQHSPSGDPFTAQRDDGGISVQHFYSPPKPSSTTGSSYRGISSLDYPDMSAWGYPPQSSGQFYSPYLSPSNSSSSSPQFQDSSFVKTETNDDISQWYNYSGSTSLDLQHSSQGRQQRPRMEPSTSQQSWQSHGSNYQSQNLWGNQNVMLQAGPQYYPR